MKKTKQYYSRNVHICANIPHLERKSNGLSRYPHNHKILTPDRHTLTVSRSNINAVGPRELGHVGSQGRVGGQYFDGKVPAEGVHVHVLRPGPDGDLRLVLQNGRRLHWLPGGDELEVQAPPERHCAERKAFGC